jgi:prophage DNA circulation protein
MKETSLTDYINDYTSNAVEYAAKNATYSYTVIFDEYGEEYTCSEIDELTAINKLKDYWYEKQDEEYEAGYSNTESEATFTVLNIGELSGYQVLLEKKEIILNWEWEEPVNMIKEHGTIGR